MITTSDHPHTKTPTSKHLSETIDAILQAAEARQLSSRAGSASEAAAYQEQRPLETASIKSSHGPLTRNELSQLEVALVSPERTDLLSLSPEMGGGSACVENEGAAELSERLAALCPLLEQHVSLASQSCFIEKTIEALSEEQASVNDFVDSWLHTTKGEGASLFTKFQQGLESATLLLSIMTLNNVDRKIINEDAVEACVSLLKHSLGQFQKSANVLERGSTNLSSMISPKRKRGNSSNSPNGKARSAGKINSPIQWSKEQIGAFKKVHKMLMIVLPNVILLMTRMGLLIEQVSLDDRQVPLIALACIQMLTISETSYQAIQLQAIVVVCGIFRRCPRYREVIFEDVFPILLQLPSPKRGRIHRVDCPPELWSDLSNTCNTKHIQLISLLITQLIQCCVIKPRLPSKIEDSANDDNNEYSSGLTQAVQYSNSFASQLLSRCNTKNEDGRASEFRPILTSIVDDLLSVHLLPQFPAASILLVSFCRCITSQLALQLQKQQFKFENTYLNSAIDTLGKICSHIVYHQSKLSSNPYTLPKPRTEFNPNATATDDSEKIGCLCGNSTRDKFSLDCDICHVWFHGACVGVRKDAFPEIWLCHGCRVGKAVQKVTDILDSKCKTSKSKKNQMPIAEKWIYRQVWFDNCSNNLFCNHLDANTHLSIWIQQLLDESDDDDRQDFGVHVTLAKHFLEKWNDESPKTLQMNVAGSNNQNEIPLEHQIQIWYKVVVSYSDLYSSTYRSSLGVLVKCMSNERSIVLKKCAIKAIHATIETNPNLLDSLPTLRRAIHAQFSSPHISVREAAVNLVGMYTSYTNKFDVYLDPLLLRLDDDGVSVRRRVVKILAGGMHLLSGKDRALACHNLLSCASNPKEEDSVQDLIHDLFMKLWFELYRKNQDEEHDSGTSRRLISAKEYHSNITEQILNVISHSSMISNIDENLTLSYIKDMVRQLASGFGREGEINNEIQHRSKRRDEMEQHCRYLIDAFLEHLLLFEESKTSLDRQSDSTTSAAHILVSIDVLSSACPELVSMKVVELLLPYLKPDAVNTKSNANVSAKDATLITLAALGIITRTLPFLSQAQIMSISSNLVDDAVKICYAGIGENIVGKATEAICCLERYNPKSEVREKLLKLSDTFFKYAMGKLQSLKSDSKTAANISVQNNLSRSLTVLGSICRYHDESKNCLDKVAGDSPLTNLVTNLYNMFTSLIPFTPSAIKACVCVWISNPHILLNAEKEGLISKLLYSNESEVRLHTLRGLLEVLTAEEWRHSHRASNMAQDEEITLAQKVTGDQDSDASLVGSILTQHSHTVLEMTSNIHPPIRMAATSLVGELLKAGLMNPMEAIPYLFALQGDVGFVGIRELAKKVLISEGERRPDTIKCRIPHGIRRAYDFQRSLIRQKCQSMHRVTAIVLTRGKETGVRCIFQDIFNECVGTSRSQRQAVYRACIGIFQDFLSDNDAESMNEVIDSSPSKRTRSPKISPNKRRRKRSESGPSRNRNKFVADDEMPSPSLDLCVFSAQILAHLEYTELADPLYILQVLVHPLIDMQGREILDRLLKIVHTDDDFDDDQDDPIEKIFGSQRKSSDIEKQELCNRLFANSKFEVLIEKASAIVLLLRLKIFLKTYYGISEEKIIAFGNDSAAFTKDKCSSSNRCAIYSQTLPATTKDLETKAVGYLKQHIEFRRLMRDEIGIRAEPTGLIEEGLVLDE